MALNAILISLYWFSFPYVGLHVLSLLENRWESKPVTSDPVIRFFIGMCVGLISFLPLVLVGYLFSLPIGFLSILWVSVIATFLTRYRNDEMLKHVIKSIVRCKLFWPLLAVLVADYSVSIYVGGYLSGDAWGHIARINDVFQNGLTFYDPFFPNLIDARAVISLMHPIYATGAKLTGSEPAEIWFYSLGFFRLALTLSTYVATKLLTKNRLIASLTSMVMLVALSFDWRFVVYPNKISRLWLVFIGFVLIRFLNNPTNVLTRIMLTTGALAAALTHPVSSAGVGFFVSMSLVFGAIYSKSTSVLVTYRFALLPITILFSSAVLAILLPVRGSIGEGVIDRTIELLGTEIINPERFFTVAKVATLSVVVAFSFRIKRSLGIKSVVAAALLTYILLAFTPIYGLLREYLPPQIIERFKTNTNFILYSTGLVTAVILCWYWLTNRLIRNEILSALVSTFVAFMLVVSYSSRAIKFAQTQKTLNTGSRDKIEAITDFSDTVNFSDEDIIVSTENTGYVASSILNVSVVKIPDGHAARSADPAIRSSCLSELLSTDVFERRKAIYTLKPRYYLLDSATAYLGEAPELSELKASSSTPEYKLYQINYSYIGHVNTQSDSCAKIVSGEA